jgi:hypothetical protein
MTVGAFVRVMQIDAEARFRPEMPTIHAKN